MPQQTKKRKAAESVADVKSKRRRIGAPLEVGIENPPVAVQSGKNVAHQEQDSMPLSRKLHRKAKRTHLPKATQPATPPTVPAIPNSQHDHSIPSTIPPHNGSKWKLASVAAGGFGSVYRVQGHDVIVKVLKLDNLHHSHVWMPVVEIRALKRLQDNPHKFIAHQPTDIEDFDPISFSRATGSLYMLFDQYASDLYTVQRATGHLAENLLRKIAFETVQGLNHLHSLGIIHRDLKPENIFVDKEGHCRIGDFGAAHMVDHNRSNTPEPLTGGYMMGATSGAFTAPFFAPEVALQVPLVRSSTTFNGYIFNETADFWSLGMSIYNMMFGEHQGEYELDCCRGCYVDMYSEMQWRMYNERCHLDLQEFISRCCNFHPCNRMNGVDALLFCKENRWDKIAEKEKRKLHWQNWMPPTTN